MEEKKIENNSQCVICGEKIEYYSIGQCNHKEICYYCTLKNRTFYNDKKCPLCNTNLDIVFISPKTEIKTFEELSKEDLSSYYKDNESDEIGVYYTDISSLEASMKLKSYKCPIEYCVKEEPFEKYEDLNHHLIQNHQKFYCKVCVKDGKKFISEQKVYSKSEINEHNLYGDIDEDIPPHHKCPFCGDLYYNDEILYKHMSNSHFMCEICKSVDKKIIFYSALPNLLQHKKLYHYCCPYKECKDILYVAFYSKKQLIQHFESKHNQKNNNLNEKMANENIPKIIEDPTLFDISMKKDEFDFNEFLEKVNKRCIKHRESKNMPNNEENTNNNINNNENNNINNNIHNNINTDDIEIIYNNRKFENSNDYYGRGGYYNYKRGFRGKRKKLGTYGNNNFFIKQNFNTYEPEEEDRYINKIKIKELDYEFIINYFIELLKKYIINYIKKNKIPKNEIYLQKETQYQLIMIIDKINDNKKILELYNIQNFGIDLDKIQLLKECLIKADQVNENELFDILDTLTTKNILVLYKYLIISYKKIVGDFYKLEMEQITENLYNQFFPNSKNNEKKLNGYASFSLNQTLNNNNINNNINSHKNNEKKNKKKKNWNQNYIVGLNDNKRNNNHQKSKQNIENQKKKQFDKYIQKCKEEDEKLEKEKNEKNKNNDDNNKGDKKNNKKSKLAMLMNSSNNSHNINNKHKNTEGFKLSEFNMDEDFPPLK